MAVPLHRRLWVVVAAALLPTAALAAIALLTLQNQRRQEIVQANVQTMRALVGAVDGELTNIIAVAETLAASDALSADALPRFYDEAVAVAAANPNWVTLVLSDSHGDQLLNTQRPLGSTLSSYRGRRSFQRVVETAQPAIGDLSVVDLDRRPGFAVRVPVLRDRKTRYVLTVVAAPEAMVDVLQRQRVAKSGVVSILDSRGNHVARSRGHEAYLGHPGSAPLRQLMDGKAEGWGNSVTLEGDPIYAAFSRSARTGWSVAVGLPAEEIDAAVRQSFMAVGFGLLLSVAIGALASLTMARLVTDPIRMLRDAAQAVGRGEIPKAKAQRVAEIQEVQQALVGAATARRKAEGVQAELLERETEARELAEKANRAKDEFLAMLGHELRNPLAAISSASHVLLSHAPNTDTPLRARAEGIIRRQSDHLARLVDDLLDVSRVMQGKVALARETLDLADIVEESVSTLVQAERTGGHRVQVETMPVWVRADADRLEQVVNNLLVNALKYTPEGGTIEVRCEQAVEGARITVSDDGVGIEAELLPKIFELFSQAESAIDRAQGGLGIGLTLVGQLVEMHGGTVTVESAGRGKGSRFIVTLPTVEAPATESLPRTTAPPVALRALLIEDNIDARDMLKELLEAHGHAVETAGTGLEGVAQAIASRPAIAFVDLGLPGIDGFEVARRLRKHFGARELLLVALSGYGSAQDKRRTAEAGFDRHLLKPISMPELDAALRDAQETASASDVE